MPVGLFFLRFLDTLGGEGESVCVCVRNGAKVGSKVQFVVFLFFSLVLCRRWPRA